MDLSPSRLSPCVCARPPRARGFTLVEMLVATTLTLLMMATVATIFTRVSDSMRDSRSTVGMNDRLRSVKNRLQSDLSGVTVTMLPPRRPEAGEGYFEYIEGPIGPVVIVGTDDMNTVSSTDSGDFDSTLGDNDDILMFTTRNLKEPFIGRFGNDTIQSTVAEVCWFVRGTTLYRRVLLVVPGIAPTPTVQGFYREADLSVRQEPSNRAPNAATAIPNLVANSLGDLAKRENRYAHQPFAFPHDARFWGRLGLPTLRESSDNAWPYPGNLGGADPSPPAPGVVQSPLYDGFDAKSVYVLPPDLVPVTIPNPSALPNQILMVSLNDGGSPFDAWTNPNPWNEVHPVTGNLNAYSSNNTRIAEDIILTNVVAFDVKAWDPGAPILNGGGGSVILPGDPNYIVNGALGGPIIAYGAYVDLNYMCRINDTTGDGLPDDIAGDGSILFPLSGSPAPYFYAAGDPRSRLRGRPPGVNLSGPEDQLAAVYDTWSFHYEHDGIDQDPETGWGVDQATDGLDNNNFGGVDDESEWETAPPYRAPLRGIQVKIRVFDPDSRQIREVTIRQDFLPE